MIYLPIVLLLLIPGIYNYLDGRRLLRRLDEPIFPELYFAYAQRSAGVVIVCVIGLAFFPGAPLWLPLTFLSSAVGNFSFRRTIFHETWGLFACLSHGLRVNLMSLRNLLLVAFLPTLIQQTHLAAPQAAVPVAVLLPLLILASVFFNTKAFRLFMPSRPLAHPHLEPAFEEVLTKADCQRPELLRTGPEGGSFVQAFAVPSISRPLVVFSEDVLEALGPKETVAIFAHEVSHLEEFHPRKLWRDFASVVCQVALVLGICFGTGLESTITNIFVWVWPLFTILIFQKELAENQAREHESDLRAVELSGEPRALADALEKIHHLGRMPRRWTTRDESKFSHPSLAQRLRAIREVAEPTAPSAPSAIADSGNSEELVVRGKKDALILGSERLHWLSKLPEGSGDTPEELLRAAGESRALPYSELADLRLLPAQRKGLLLAATDSQGRSLEIPLPDETANAVKSRLARLEPLLGGATPVTTANPTRPSAWLRVDALLVMLQALLNGFTTLFALCILVVIRPVPATLAASGALALTLAAALFLGFDSLFLYPGTGTWGSAATLIFFGGVLLYAAWQRRQDSSSPAWTWVPPAIWMTFLILLSLTFGLFRMAQPLPGVALHNWAREFPSLALLAPGLAALLLTRTWRFRKVLAAVLLLSTLTVFALASEFFRSRFAGHPLGPRPAPLVSEDPPLELLREIPLEHSVHGVAFSPSGQSLALHSWIHSRASFGAGRTQFDVETGNGQLLPLNSQDLVFFDDTRLLLLHGEETLQLSTWSLRPTTEEPQTWTLPELDPQSLRAFPDGRFRLLGLQEDDIEATDFGIPYGGNVVVIEGRLSVADLETWVTPVHQGESWSEVTINDDGQLLETLNHYGDGELGFAWADLLNFDSSTTELRLHQGDDHHTLFEVPDIMNCAAAIGAPYFLCTLYEMGDSSLWLVDPEQDRPRSLGSLEEAGDPQPTLDGRFLVSGYEGAMMLIDPASPTALRLGPQLGSTTVADTLEQTPEGEQILENPVVDTLLENALNLPYLPAVSVVGDHVAIVAEGDDGNSRLLLYRFLPQR